MKAIIKIGKVECKFEVPEKIAYREDGNDMFNVLYQTDFMREAKKLALSLYRETKKNANL